MRGLGSTRVPPVPPALDMHRSALHPPLPSTRTLCHPTAELAQRLRGGPGQAGAYPNASAGQEPGVYLNPTFSSAELQLLVDVSRQRGVRCGPASHGACHLISTLPLPPSQALLPKPSMAR